jgi:hypothetical protein
MEDSRLLVLQRAAATIGPDVNPFPAMWDQGKRKAVRRTARG